MLWKVGKAITFYFSQRLKILNLTPEIDVCVCRHVQCAFISYISEEVELGKNSKIFK